MGAEETRRGVEALRARRAEIEREQAESAAAGEPADDESAGDGEATGPPAAEPAGEPAGRRQSAGSAGGSVTSDAAGVVLGFLAWVWVVLPFIHGGPSQVGAVLRAKFTNKGSDGSPLP